MRTIVCTILMLATVLSVLCGCTRFSANNSSSEISADTGSDSFVIVNLPTDDSVNGYRLPSKKTADGRTIINYGTQSSNDETNQTYCANTKSNKFHKADCTYAKKTDDDNKYITDSRQELINQGYEPCKHCNP